MNAAAEHLVAQIVGGKRSAIARAVSAMENDDAAACVLRNLLAPHLGRAHVIGITGPPGAGKSTLINGLLGEFIARGRRIAVVAVDPSSPVTGGAVLGDRVRMGEHGAHDNVFIRSLSSRGHLGGVSRTTACIVDVFDAAGFDIVIVETVGTGQSEVEITGIADTRVVICPPGAGDDVQAIKAGILEIADVLVVNKGDLPTADATMRYLKDMLRLRRNTASRVPVLKTLATRGEGIAAVVDAALVHGATVGRGRRLAVSHNSTGDPIAIAPGDAEAAAVLVPPAEIGTAAEKDRVMRLATRDPFAAALGIRCIDAGPGRATVTLTVRGEHLNFNDTCHGGVLFALADTAFGLASNSHGVIAAGIDAHISYHQAARPGQVLTATAREISRTRKLAFYRVELSNAEQMMISSFTGTVYVTERPNELPSRQL